MYRMCVYRPCGPRAEKKRVQRALGSGRQAIAWCRLYHSIGIEYVLRKRTVVGSILTKNFLEWASSIAFFTSLDSFALTRHTVTATFRGGRRSPTMVSLPEWLRGWT